jgi:GT2 family glycosyltransferase/glycosyltransferase involved in cell wall biosynthesis
MILLHAIHDFLPRHQAGSEIYALRLCQELARRHTVVVVCAKYDPTRAHGSLTWRSYQGLPVVELVNNWMFQSFEDTYRSPAIATALEHVLRAVQPDVLHVHNLLNLSMDLPSLARSRGIPTVATLHDFSLVCPSGGQRVHLADEHVCHEIDTARCARCFPESPFYRQMVFAQVAGRSGGFGRAATVGRALLRRLPATTRFIERAVSRSAGPAISSKGIDRRLDAARGVFEAVDLFVAPSAALAADFERFGLPAAKLLVSDNGFPTLGHLSRSNGNGRLRLGFVGTLAWHKGVHVLVQAARQLPQERFELRIFGDVNTFPDYTAVLRAQAQGLSVHFMGAFDNTDAPAVYADIDVLVVPSLWPENSPVVIHEAFMAGVPVVGARVGGIPELVTHGVNGLLYEAYSPSDLAGTLRTLIENPERVGRLAAGAPSVKGIADDACQWEARYEPVLGRVRSSPTIEKDLASPGASGRHPPRLAAVVVNYRTPEQTRLSLDSLRASRRRIDDLIVVDNGAEGAGAALDVPGVTVLDTTENLGFSGGCNVGIRHALATGADLVLLVNSDVWLPPDCLGQLEDVLVSDATIGIVGPLLLSRSEPEQVLSLGISFSERSGRMRHEGHGRRFGSLAPCDRRTVAGVSGCVMLVRREVFERIGLLDEDYFFSFEDLDFCLRARRAGYPSAVIGGALAYHEGSASIGPRSPSRVYFASRNHLLLADRAAPASSRARRLFRAGCIVAFNVAYALVSRPTPVWQGVPAVARGIRDHVRGRYGGIVEGGRSVAPRR